MSYYQYITGIYKSYLPQLNRTLRSSSVPRRVPDVDTSRYSRSSSVPPSFLSSDSFLSRHSATPFRDRATSVPPRSYYPTMHERLNYEKTTYGAYGGSHYSDYDYKVTDYMNKMDRQQDVRSQINQSRNFSTNSSNSNRNYSSDSYSSRYNYYDGVKHERDYLYPSTNELMGNWKHCGLSNSTLKERSVSNSVRNERMVRETSPLVSRELNRYYGTQKRVDYMGDVSSGGMLDFRHYNYRKVPYYGGSDHYKHLPKMCRTLNGSWLNDRGTTSFASGAVTPALSENNDFY